MNRLWTTVCPDCGAGFFCSSGMEFERILRRHQCPEGTIAALYDGEPA